MRAVDAAGMSGNHAEIVAQPRLVKAAHEFEAQLMKELLKPMTGGDDSSAEGVGGILGEFAAEALGRALSERGGLGIAGSIVRSLTHPGNSSRFEPAAARQTEKASNH